MLKTSKEKRKNEKTRNKQRRRKCLRVFTRERERACDCELCCGMCVSVFHDDDG
jgi:hypothetical protein